MSRRTAILPLKELVSFGKIYLANQILARFLILFSLRFPSSKSEHHLYSEWIHLLQQHLKPPLFVANIDSKVCSNHLEEHCLDRKKERRLCLQEDSKPTLLRNSHDAAQQVFKQQYITRQLF